METAISLHSAPIQDKSLILTGHKFTGCLGCIFAMWLHVSVILSPVIDIRWRREPLDKP